MWLYHGWRGSWCRALTVRGPGRGLSGGCGLAGVKGAIRVSQASVCLWSPWLSASLGVCPCCCVARWRCACDVGCVCLLGAFLWLRPRRWRDVLLPDVVGRLAPADGLVRSVSCCTGSVLRMRCACGQVSELGCRPPGGYILFLRWCAFPGARLVEGGSASPRAGRCCLRALSGAVLVALWSRDVVVWW